MTIETPWALVPVSPLAESKRRLAGRLDPNQRAALAGRLLGHTLAVLAAFPGARRSLVVSQDETVLRQARAHGMATVREAGPRDLNRALTMAATLLPGGPMVIVPIDLPGLAPSPLRRLCQHRDRDRAVIIATDRAGTGTNIMAVPDPHAIRFRYGIRSRQRHTAEALRAGLGVRILRLPALALDIDTPADLDRLEAGG